MQLVVEVFGVEQVCDFDTMKTEAFVVLNIFGEPIRVPITEEQMALLTEKATIEHTSQGAGGELTESFEETRAQMTSAPTGGAKISERAFSPMVSLEGRDPDPPEAQTETDPGFGGAPTFGGMFDEPEADKEAKLRNRNQEARRVKPSADSAGNPVVETAPRMEPPRSLPAIGNPASDDDYFVQG